MIGSSIGRVLLEWPFRRPWSRRVRICEHSLVGSHAPLQRWVGASAWLIPRSCGLKLLEQVAVAQRCCFSTRSLVLDDGTW